MGINITFGNLKNPDLKHMGKHITLGIYKNILQWNNMGENGHTEAGLPPKFFNAPSSSGNPRVEIDLKGLHCGCVKVRIELARTRWTI